MALLVDTSLLVEQERDAAQVRGLVSGEEWSVSVITVSELLHGVHRATGARRVRRQSFVEGILAAVEAIPVTEPVARVHAELWASLVRRGVMVGLHDLWIAATALVHGLGVATRDVEDFRHVRGLRVVSPT